MYVYTPSMFVACGGQTRVSDPLKLDLHMVMNHYVGDGK